MSSYLQHSGCTFIACLSPGCQKRLTKIPNDLLFLQWKPQSYTLDLSRSLTFSSPLPSEAHPSRSSHDTPPPILLLGWPLLDLSSWLLRLSVHLTAVGPTVPCFTICPSLHILREVLTPSVDSTTFFVLTLPRPMALALKPI